MILYPKKNAIHDDYFVTDQVLGNGASRPVVLCVHKKTNVKYALKVLEDSSISRREIDLHWRASEQSAHVVKIKDLYQSERLRKIYFFLITEYMEGGELFEKLVKRNEPFSEQEVAKMMFQICSGVQDLHQMNIAHRDLKPENLLLTTNDNFLIKITDFGFAKENKSGLNSPCYSPEYAAPEILNAGYNRKYDISCDIWSLGVVMFILCFGYAPFQKGDFDSLKLDKQFNCVSQEAKDLICAMLNKTPEKRIKISDILKHPWILNNNSSTSQSKLASLTILKNSQENWPKVKEEYDSILEKMRLECDYEPMNIKKSNLNSNNQLVFKKHKQKVT